jgi:hypothetical protein
VIGILRPSQSRLDDRKARLHEHDEKARDERPDEVGGNQVLTDGG